MASFFIYDSINMYRSDNTDSEGTITTGTFASEAAVTLHERASDMNIGTGMSDIVDNDAIQYAIGSSATADAAAVYFLGDDGVASGTIMTFYASDTTGVGSSIGTISAVSGAGWQVVSLTESTNTKFYTEFNATITNNIISEILIGKKLAFEVEPDINIQTAKDYGTQVQKSLGGVEYAINTHNGQEIFTISFQNISSTFKSDLLTFEDANKAQGKKFLYYDGTNYNWVRLDRPMVFTEVADGRFSTQIVMRQQIQ
jgi:hypothetical protein